MTYIREKDSCFFYEIQIIFFIRNERVHEREEGLVNKGNIECEKNGQDFKTISEFLLLSPN